MIDFICVSSHKVGANKSWAHALAQWASHPPQEQKTRVRIPPEMKALAQNEAFKEILARFANDRELHRQPNKHCLRVCLNN
jgi:hypothetical protein